MNVDAPVLEIEGLGRYFGALKVIDQLNLSVGATEILGIIGPNGAGKTTLFNLVAGVMAPTHGAIRFNGRDISQLRSWNRCRLGISRTYQIPKPFLHMTIFENVLVAAVHGAGLSLSAGRLLSEEVLHVTGLSAHHDKPAGRLSLLNLKRLELSRALAAKPRLLLLDEIAGGLTDAECEALLETISSVHAGGVAIVWIEHVIHALRRLATRLAVLYGGGIIFAGAPTEVLADDRVKNIYLGE